MKAHVSENGRLTRLRYWSAGLSIFAGLIHGVVTPEHFEEWWGYGAFFFVAALAQIFYGVLLLLLPWAYDETGAALGTEADRRTATYCIVGILGNAAIVALWIVTRTVGIPFFGPEAGEIEPITAISLVSKLIEVALVACLFLIVRRTRATSYGTGASA
ncbi:MAG: hypothetical protein M1546_18050 [Chloroflexi bacterium]|nr:hypothetical protein [Chloroflexota bacterium]